MGIVGVQCPAVAVRLAFAWCRRLAPKLIGGCLESLPCPFSTLSPLWAREATAIGLRARGNCSQAGATAATEAETWSDLSGLGAPEVALFSDGGAQVPVRSWALLGPQSGPTRLPAPTTLLCLGSGLASGAMEPATFRSQPNGNNSQHAMGRLL